MIRPMCPQAPKCLGISRGRGLELGEKTDNGPKLSLLPVLGPTLLVQSSSLEPW